MAIPNSRKTLIQYCLRRLGHPVIKINVDPDQIEDRVDEALQMFQQFHTDAVTHIFYSYQIQQTDITNQYITIPPSIISVVNVLPIQSDGGDNLFNVQYQERMSQWDALYGSGAGGGISSYDVTMGYLDLIDFEFDVNPNFEFNQHQGRLFIEMDWNTIPVGTYIVAEGYQIVDGNEFTSIWNDMWLKQYLTVLIKMNWAEVLKKYKGTAMLGGVTLNANEMYLEAIQEKERLEKELHKTWTLPPRFFMG